MITTYSESVQEFLDLLRLEPDYNSEALHLLEVGDSRYTTDLKVNFKNSFNTELLSKKEATLLGVALAVNDKNKVLLNFFVQEAREQKATEQEIAEAVGCASLLSANNVFYRFRHFMQKTSGVFRRFFYEIMVTFVSDFFTEIRTLTLCGHETSSLLFTHRASFNFVRLVSASPDPN